ncbi:MAG: TetR/AcrR family transcriptional regulator [Leptospiraceae bacterium]|nr:TetR/AcrR family transcriptional regulator [Leptospiraceae bacterium]
MARGQTKEKQARGSQDRILRAAVKVMARKGYHGTRISDIAAEADVAYGLVYHYFGSKEKVLETILASVAQRFSDRIARIGAEPGTLTEKLGRISDYMLDTYLANPEMIHLLVQEVVRSGHIDPVSEMASARAILQQIQGIVEAGKKTGDLAADTDAELLSITFFGAIELTLTALVQGLYSGHPGRTSADIKEIRRKLRSIVQGGSFGRKSGKGGP